jgi:hypothetical protein
MQANPIVRLDEENLAETSFEHFKCPVEFVVPYLINDPELTDALSAYYRSRFKSSIWNMDSPWMVAIFGTLGCTFLGFMLLAIFREYFAYRSISIAFSLFAFSTLLAIPATYAALVSLNLRAGYGRYWWRKLSGPTHIGITELGFKLYVRGRFFYNYPNLAVWKDIKDVHIRPDTVYNVPSICFSINSNYTFREVVLPVTGFSSETHLLLVLRHLRQHVEEVKQSQYFVELANANFEPVIHSYRENTTVENISKKIDG